MRLLPVPPPRTPRTPLPPAPPLALPTDKSPNVVEQYNGVNLDPDSPNYIARKIGDRYPQFNDTLGKVEILVNY